MDTSMDAGMDAGRDGGRSPLLGATGVDDDDDDMSVARIFPMSSWDSVPDMDEPAATPRVPGCNLTTTYVEGSSVMMADPVVVDAGLSARNTAVSSQQFGVCSVDSAAAASSSAAAAARESAVREWENAWKDDWNAGDYALFGEYTPSPLPQPDTLASRGPANPRETTPIPAPTATAATSTPTPTPTLTLTTADNSACAAPTHDTPPPANKPTFRDIATRAGLSDLVQESCEAALGFLGPLVKGEDDQLRKHVGGSQGRNDKTKRKTDEDLIALIGSESAQAPVAAVELLGKALHRVRLEKVPKCNKYAPLARGSKRGTLLLKIDAAWRSCNRTKSGKKTRKHVLYPKCRQNRKTMDMLWRLVKDAN
jgi:hypothetical protein